MALLNATKYNLLRWHDANPSPDPLPVWGGRSSPCSPLLVWKPGEAMRFYVPLAFTPGTLQVFQADGVTSAGTAACTFTGFAVASGTHAVGEATCPALPDGVYKLGIGSWRSQEIEICSDAEELAALTAVVEFSHTGAFRDFLYPYVFEEIEGWTQRFRLRLVHKKTGDKSTKSEYEAARTGRMRLSGVIQQTFDTFSTPEVSLDDQDALKVMIYHDYLTINGVRYVCESDYSREFDPTTRPGRSGHGGEFSLYRRDAAFVLR